MPKILIQTRIKAPKQLVFNLARSIDLHQKSAVGTNEKVIAGKFTGLIELNETVTWKAKHFGIYQTLTAKITEYDYSNFFVDEMVEGAFASFRHEHQFTYSNGYTIMADVFDYKSPFGILGRLVDFIFLKRYMTVFLMKRNEVIKDYAESGKGESLLA